MLAHGASGQSANWCARLEARFERGVFEIHAGSTRAPGTTLGIPNCTGRCSLTGTTLTMILICWVNPAHLMLSLTGPLLATGSFCHGHGTEAAGARQATWDARRWFGCDEGSSSRKARGVHLTRRRKALALQLLTRVRRRASRGRDRECRNQIVGSWRALIATSPPPCPPARTVAGQTRGAYSER